MEIASLIQSSSSVGIFISPDSAETLRYFIELWLITKIWRKLENGFNVSDEDTMLCNLGGEWWYLLTLYHQLRSIEATIAARILYITFVISLQTYMSR